MSDVTQLLNAIDAGDPKAADQLLPLVYEELRKLAAAKMAQEKPGQTLQATALVHEAWLRLAGPEEQKGWNSRGHFFGAAAEAMRRILVDRARQKLSLKRGAGAERINLDDLEVAAAADDDTLLAVDEAMAKLAKEDPASAEFIKLRFFVGLTNEKAAQALGIPERTARRHWSFARAWLHRELLRQGQA
jgi:RNA polymerase sigma factor (TIGR02999 family)